MFTIIVIVQKKYQQYNIDFNYEGGSLIDRGKPGKLISVGYS